MNGRRIAGNVEVALSPQIWAGSHYEGGDVVYFIRNADGSCTPCPPPEGTPAAQEARRERFKQGLYTPDDLALLGEKRLRRALGMPIAGDEVDDVDEINETPRTGGGLNAPIDHGYGMGVPKPELSPERQARSDQLKAERQANFGKRDKRRK